MRKSKKLVRQVAHNFSVILRCTILPKEMDEIVRRNQCEPGGKHQSDVCHSHDFCDANMAMHAALLCAGFNDGPKSKPGSAWSDMGIDVFNEAWGIAKANDFKVEGWSLK